MILKSAAEELVGDLSNKTEEGSIKKREELGVQLLEFILLYSG